jgi:protein ImuB
MFSTMSVMERLACVIVPALPLQLLAVREPAFRTGPAVWVDDLRPHGQVLATNRAARAVGVLPGMRHAAALALHGGLRAGAVAGHEVAAVVGHLATLLRQFSPRVEPCDPEREAGVFWLDADGLDGLFGSPEQWAHALREHLQQHGWRATVVVGRERFATYAIARQFGGVRVCSPQQEAQWLARVTLAALGPLLGLAPETRDALGLLGITTLAEFLALPPAAVRERHGEQAFEVHRRAAGALSEPLRPLLLVPVPEAWRDLEPPDDNAERLLFVARGLLVGLVREVVLRREAVAAVRVQLDLEAGRTDQPAVERELVAVLQPAEPTLDEATLVDLVRVWLERAVLPAKVVRLGVALQSVAANAAQLRLWQLNGRRNLDAATRALARLRAAFGSDAVVRAELRRGHLPEARYGWVPLQQVVAAHTDGPAARPLLVRRAWRRPQVLPARPRHEPDGWLLRNWRQGRVVRAWGPFRLSGGWWVREVRRDYHWLETEAGDWLWVFWDQVRRQWFVQAEVD